MSILALVAFVQQTPWVALLPIVGLGFLDALLGVWMHVVQGHETFTWNRFADWLENSVGVQKLALVAITALLVVLTQGTAAGVASLLVLCAASGTAYAAIVSDVVSKLKTILSTAAGK